MLAIVPITAWGTTDPVITPPPDWFEPLGTSGQVDTVLAADFDDDGVDELVVVQGGTVRVYRGGPGGLSFDLLLEGVFGSATVADVSGDGIADLVQASEFPTGSVKVHLGGPGGVRLVPDVVIPSMVYSAEPVAAGDLDGDGYQDLIIPDSWNGSTHQWTWWRGAAGGALVRTSWSAWGNAVAVGDVTGDGFGDVAVAPFDGPVELFPGTASGPSSTTSWSVSRAVRRMAVADATGDGVADLLVDDGASVFTFATDGTTLVAQPTVTPLPVRSGWAMRRIEVEGVEFVMLPGEDRVWFFPAVALPSDALSWGPPFATASSTQWNEVDFGLWCSTTGDFDGDGVDDLAVGATVRWKRNQPYSLDEDVAVSVWYGPTGLLPSSDSGDTGAPTTGGGTGTDTTSPPEAPDPPAGPPSEPPASPAKTGCGCGGGARDPGLLVAAIALAARRARRRARSGG